MICGFVPNVGVVFAVGVCGFVPKVGLLLLLLSWFFVGLLKKKKRKSRGFFFLLKITIKPKLYCNLGNVSNIFHF